MVRKPLPSGNQAVSLSCSVGKKTQIFRRIEQTGHAMHSIAEFLVFILQTLPHFDVIAFSTLFDRQLQNGLEKSQTVEFLLPFLKSDAQLRPFARLLLRQRTVVAKQLLLLITHHKSNKAAKRFADKCRRR